MADIADAPRIAACSQPGAQTKFAKYGGLARDGISCALCHHLGPHDTPQSDPWEVFYGFKDPAVAGLEKPVGLPYPFAGSVSYNLNKFSAPEPDPIDHLSVASTTTGHPEPYNPESTARDSTSVAAPPQNINKSWRCVVH